MHDAGHQNRPSFRQFRDTVAPLPPDLDRPVVSGAVDRHRQQRQLAARAARLVLPARLRARQPRRRRPAADVRRATPLEQRAERQHHQRGPASAAGRLQLEMFTDPYQAIYTSTISKNHHAIKFGVDGMFVDFVYLRYAGPTGTYTFAQRSLTIERGGTRPTRRRSASRESTGTTPICPAMCRIRGRRPTV